MSYRCEKPTRCRHLSVEFDAYSFLNGDTLVSTPQWHCLKRDDERCVPNCKEHEGARR